jgi:PIN domain nuclease of toxin-antitoxin system
VKLLLDTHVVFWWVTEPTRLTISARQAIADKSNDVFVIIASLWEMSIKVGLGKWPDAAAMVRDFELVVATERFNILPITIPHVRAAGLM